MPNDMGLTIKIPNDEDDTSKICTPTILVVFMNLFYNFIPTLVKKVSSR
jgi:hypothetical protein